MRLDGPCKSLFRIRKAVLHDEQLAQLFNGVGVVLVGADCSIVVLFGRVEITDLQV